MDIQAITRATFVSLQLVSIGCDKDTVIAIRDGMYLASQRRIERGLFAIVEGRQDIFGNGPYDAVVDAKED